ncbi:uncharacterized protein VTP21DRAFT_3570 [Calcarisporiella thermophila]|uniref:uncharacterized protein n=1 Tax=Calcarisporiella thermophila TaxID=911321 RepID=UPI003743C7F8
MAPPEMATKENDADSGVGSSVSSLEAQEPEKTEENEANAKDDSMLSPGVAALKEVFDVCYTVQLMEEERGVVERLQEMGEKMSITEEPETSVHRGQPSPPQANQGGGMAQAQQPMIYIHPSHAYGNINLTLSQNTDKINKSYDRHAGQERQRQHMAIRQQMKQHQARYRAQPFNLNIDRATLLERRKRRVAVS